jgi:hypothetical protein
VAAPLYARACRAWHGPRQALKADRLCNRVSGLFDFDLAQDDLQLRGDTLESVLFPRNSI